MSNPYAPHVEHTVVKPEQMAGTVSQFLEQELTLPNLMQKESFDAYKGSKDDAVNVKIEGVLPYHRYAFRNDRSEGLKRDVYSERTIQVTLADHFYSNLALTDEQRDFDLLDWGFLLQKQAKAIGVGLQHGAAWEIENAPYEISLAADEDNIVPIFTEARRVFNILNVPGARTMVVGSDFEAAMQNDPKINLASNAGDAQAASALSQATLGNIKGFKVVLDNTIAPDAAYAFVEGGFVWANAAPSVPRSVGYGATASYEGVALRVMQNYVHNYLEDQQVVDTWSGFRTVSDFLVGYERGADGTGVQVQSTQEHFVRGIKLGLGGESVYPTGELATITGLKAPGTAEGSETP